MVFVGAVFTLVLVIGAFIRLIEAEGQGFDKTPHHICWTIVTLTTVGHGDIIPRTLAGRVLASMVTIIGYGIVSVPTGVVSVEVADANGVKVSTQACPNCGRGA